MKILEVKTLAIRDIKVIRFGRFLDQRGYFAEPFRKSDFGNSPDLGSFKKAEIVQVNESLSKKGTVRGMHFQWNPYMGKLVRTLSGRMVDMVLDIRKGSPTYGKMIFYDMPSDPDSDACEWIWVPPGFAHGNFFPEEAAIEYLCTGEYSKGCEACIACLAQDIDWSLCDPALKRQFDAIVSQGPVMTEKDKNGFRLQEWAKDPRSDNFLFDDLKGSDAP